MCVWEGGKRERGGEGGGGGGLCVCREREWGREEEEEREVREGVLPRLSSEYGINRCFVFALVQIIPSRIRDPATTVCGHPPVRGT